VKLVRGKELANVQNATEKALRNVFGALVLERKIVAIAREVEQLMSTTTKAAKIGT
jgi:hypothetical protein